MQGTDVDDVALFCNGAHEARHIIFRNIIIPSISHNTNRTNSSQNLNLLTNHQLGILTDTEAQAPLGALPYQG